MRLERDAGPRTRPRKPTTLADDEADPRADNEQPGCPHAHPPGEEIYREQRGLEPRGSHRRTFQLPHKQRKVR
jgi:hypothetical protein